MLLSERNCHSCSQNRRYILSFLNFSWINKNHLVRTRCFTTLRTLSVLFFFSHQFFSSFLSIKIKSSTQQSSNGISSAVFRHCDASLFFMVLLKNYFSLLRDTSESTISAAVKTCSFRGCSPSSVYHEHYVLLAE